MSKNIGPMRNTRSDNSFLRLKINENPNNIGSTFF